MVTQRTQHSQRRFGLNKFRLKIYRTRLIMLMCLQKKRVFGWSDLSHLIYLSSKIQ